MLSLLLRLAVLATAALLVAAQSPSTTVTPTIYNSSSKYIYKGCYSETINIANTSHLRAISDGNETKDNTTMTASLCLSYCNTWGWKYAGIEYGQECYCGSRLSGLSQLLPSNSCEIACVGDANFYCGGSWTLSVYSLIEKKASASAVVRASISTLLGVVGLFSFYHLI